MVTLQHIYHSLLPRAMRRAIRGLWNGGAAAKPRPAKVPSRKRRSRASKVSPQPVALVPKQINVQQLPKAIYKAAQKAVSEKDYEQAADLLRSMQVIDQTEDIRYFLVNVLARSGKLEEAKAELRLLLDLHPLTVRNIELARSLGVRVPLFRGRALDSVKDTKTPQHFLAASRYLRFGLWFADAHELAVAGLKACEFGNPLRDSLLVEAGMSAEAKRSFDLAISFYVQVVDAKAGYEEASHGA